MDLLPELWVLVVRSASDPIHLAAFAGVCRAWRQTALSALVSHLREHRLLRAHTPQNIHYTYGDQVYRYRHKIFEKKVSIKIDILKRIGPTAWTTNGATFFLYETMRVPPDWRDCDECRQYGPCPEDESGWDFCSPACKTTYETRPATSFSINE